MQSFQPHVLFLFCLWCYLCNPNRRGDSPCRYFLRATVSRRLNDVVKEMDIVVHTLSTYPELNSSIKMEVGIEDCLHIEFEYNKSK